MTNRLMIVLLATIGVLAPSFVNASRGSEASGAVAADKTKKTVSIVITDDPAQAIVCAPDRLVLKRSKNHKVRWCIVNNSDADVSKVEADFGSADAIEGGPKFTSGAISSGADALCTAAHLSKKTGTFKYTITVTFADGSQQKLDPVVIVDP